MTRVLVFNFFSGVIERGIPLYAENIAESMRRVGLEPVMLRCPAWLRRLPRPVRNLAFALFEQIVAPAMRVLTRCSLTVYPYNSAGVVDAVLGRSVLVVHDFIPNRHGSLAARYICMTQTVHRLLGRPVCAASTHTLHHLRRLNGFKRCAVALWANPFYSFEAALAVRSESLPAKREPGLRVLLCSGLGANKDYAGALKAFAQSRAFAGAELRIVGFGDDAHLAERRLRHLPAVVAGRIRVLPRLSLAELVAEYDGSDLVWVHSRKDGFGRCIVEGRLAGRPVVASDIGAFRHLATLDVSLYREGGLDAAVSRALQSTPSAVPSTVRYHAPLEAAVREVIGAHAA